MSKPSDPQKAEVNERIEIIAKSLSEPINGPFSLEEVIAQLATFYATNPAYRNAYAIAERDVKGWDASKRPKDGPQGQLFKPDGVIPTGVKSQRIFMSRARREHLIGWRKVETEAFEARENVYNQRMSYIDSRLEVWDVTKYTTLQDIENALF